MATINWSFGDVFTFQAGAGVVVSAGTQHTGVSVLVKDLGGRQGYDAKKGAIPTDAVPAQAKSLPSEVQMAIKGALAAVSDW
jgi:hypothetical protein